MDRKDRDKKVSRREALSAGAAVAVGMLAATALPSVALAANGDALVAGAVKTATTETGAKLANDSLKGVFLANSVHPDPAVTARAGVMGFTSLGGSEVCGVYGRADNADAIGVAGRNFWGGDGVHGYTRSGSGAGVVGRSEGDGPGVLAAGDIALEVQGVAKFSRSGKRIISAGTTQKTVAGLEGLTSGSLILATLQGPAGPDVVIRYAKRISSTSFKVVLNKPAAKDVRFAWFIIN